MNDVKKCPLCKRECPSRLFEKHHLGTRRKSDETKEICRQCHKAIHGLFSNSMLRDEQLHLDSVKGLLQNKRFYKAVRFIRKLDPAETMKMDNSKVKQRYS
jgi:flagellar biosynthesis regulator FlbT